MVASIKPQTIKIEAGRLWQKIDAIEVAPIVSKLLVILLLPLILAVSIIADLLGITIADR